MQLPPVRAAAEGDHHGEEDHIVGEDLSDLTSGPEDDAEQDTKRRRTDT